jgi:hypothetical protein
MERLRPQTGRDSALSLRVPPASDEFRSGATEATLEDCGVTGVVVQKLFAIFGTVVPGWIAGCALVG